MSLLFSRQCEYALQAVLYLAEQNQGEKTSINKMAGDLGIPYFFLAKILQNLSHKGLLNSTRGRNGGFSLSQPAKKVTLHQIISAIDGENALRSCVLGFSECGDENPCALHAEWGPLRSRLIGILMNKSVIDLAKESKEKKNWRTHSNSLNKF